MIHRGQKEKISVSVVVDIFFRQYELSQMLMVYRLVPYRFLSKHSPCYIGPEEWPVSASSPLGVDSNCSVSNFVTEGYAGVDRKTSTGSDNVFEEGQLERNVNGMINEIGSKRISWTALTTASITRPALCLLIDSKACSHRSVTVVRTVLFILSPSRPREAKVVEKYRCRAAVLWNFLKLELTMPMFLKDFWHPFKKSLRCLWSLYD